MREDTTSGRALIIGIGNQFRGDDAFGLAVARQLRDTLPESFEVREFEGDGVALMQAWQGYETVIIVDCVATHASPGALFQLDAHLQPMPVHFFRSSSHLFGVAEAIELARTLHQLPKRLVIYGAAGQQFEAGSSMTEAVAHAVEVVVRQIRQQLVVPWVA